MARKKKSKQSAAAANGTSNGTAAPAPAPAAEAAPAPAESSTATEAPAAAPSTWDGNAMTQDDMMLKDTVLVLDDDDNVVGSESKKGSHLFNAKTQRGVLHRAFSVFLFDESTGELLLQQRASTKITFPNVRVHSRTYAYLFMRMSIDVYCTIYCKCILTPLLVFNCVSQNQHIISINQSINK